MYFCTGFFHTRWIFWYIKTKRIIYLVKKFKSGSLPRLYNAICLYVEASHESCTENLERRWSVATVACSFDRGYLYSLFKVSITCAFIRCYFANESDNMRGKKQKQDVTQLACDFKLSRCPEAAPVLFVKPQTCFQFFYSKSQRGGLRNKYLLYHCQTSNLKLSEREVCAAFKISN